MQKPYFLDRTQLESHRGAIGVDSFECFFWLRSPPAAYRTESRQVWWCGGWVVRRLSENRGRSALSPELVLTQNVRRHFDRCFSCGRRATGAENRMLGSWLRVSTGKPNCPAAIDERSSFLWRRLVDWTESHAPIRKRVRRELQVWDHRLDGHPSIRGSAIRSMSK